MITSERIQRLANSIHHHVGGTPQSTLFNSLRFWIIEKIGDYRLPGDIFNGINHALTILPYGSTVAGTSLGNGDADFAVAFYSISERCKAIEIDRLRQEQVLSELFEQIRKKSEIRNSQRIFRARVPVIKFSIENPTNSNFDLCSSVNGVRNSLLIRQYMEHSPRLHLGCLLAKLWGRSFSILNSHRGWLSPYAMTILYIYYLQTTTAPLSVQPTASLDDLLHTCHVGKYSELQEFNTQLPVRFFDICGIEKDIKGFFKFYSEEFDFDSAVIDIRTTSPIFQKDEWIHSITDISSADRWNLLGHENLFIRDPYEPHSLGRSVDFLKSEQIREVFRVSSKQEDSLFFLNDLKTN